MGMRNFLFYILVLSTFAAYSQNNCVDVLTTSLQDAACNSPISYTGSATISVLNGSGNYTYEWQDTNTNPLFPHKHQQQQIIYHLVIILLR